MQVRTIDSGCCDQPAGTAPRALPGASDMRVSGHTTKRCSPALGMCKGMEEYRSVSRIEQASLGEGQGLLSFFIFLHCLHTLLGSCVRQCHFHNSFLFDLFAERAAPSTGPAQHGRRQGLRSDRQQAEPLPWHVVRCDRKNGTHIRTLIACH